MTHYKQLSEVLRNYYDIPDQELEKINRLFYLCKLKKGEFFVRSGFMADSIGFVVSGLLRYYYTDRNGVEYTKAFAAENDFAVAYASMLLKQPSAFSIEALENSVLLCIEYSDWEKLLESVPCWNIVARKVVEKVMQASIMSAVFKNGIEDFSKLRNEIETNFIAPVMLAEKFIPLLIGHERAAIINITSYFGISPKPSAPIYSATKAAMRSFTKSLRMQLRDTRIKVFDVAPPIIDTPLTANSNPNVKKMKPEELVEIVWEGLENDKYDIYPGLSKLFYILSRVNPRYLENKVMATTLK